MTVFRADLHIHSVLSPCGDFGMSPSRIIAEAVNKGLDIIGITDHNCTRHGKLIRKLGKKQGVFVLTGAEITTKEEIHCLAFFEDDQCISLLQDFLDTNLPFIENDPLRFGYQVQVDEEDNIIYEEKKLLINSISRTLEEVEDFIHRFGGIFIPAHVDRKKNSVFSQLGFIPPDLKVDALEISKRSTISGFRSVHPELGKYRLISCSDAHYPDEIGCSSTLLEMEKISFQEIRMTMAGINGRRIITE